MIDWRGIDKGAIFRDKSKDGLLVKFLKDYKNIFGGSVNASCIKCLEKYYFLMTNIDMESKKEKHGFILKSKYNGIISTVTKRPYRNGDLTQKQAIELIEKHPRGKYLFDKIPTSYFKKEKKVTTKKAK